MMFYIILLSFNITKENIAHVTCSQVYICFLQTQNKRVPTQTQGRPWREQLNKKQSHFNLADSSDDEMQ